MHQLRSKIQKDNPGVPYFMMAHSMGSYMLRKYLCIHNENLSGAIIMGTGCVPDGTMKFGMWLCKVIAASASAGGFFTTSTTWEAQKLST